MQRCAQHGKKHRYPTRGKDKASAAQQEWQPQANAVMDPSTGKEFEKPFGASTFGDIAMILDIEVPAMLAR